MRSTPTRSTPAPAPSPMLTAALAYLDKGWRPIPLYPRGKRPLVAWERFQERQPTEDEVRGWFAKWPDANVAIVTGASTGIVAIDRDDDQGEVALAEAVGLLPTTPTSITAKGNHRVFAHPGGMIKTRTGVLPRIDVRGDGGYIVAPPSVHESGHVYTWAVDFTEIEPAPMPDALIRLLRDDNAGQPRNNKVTEGARNDTLTREVGRLFGQGLTKDEVLDNARNFNDARLSPPLDDKEVIDTVNSIARREKKQKRSPRGPARLLVRTMANVARESVEWLVEGYFPLGLLTMVEGEPGIGKSHVVLDLAARVSRGAAGPMGLSTPQGGVILIAKEDLLGATVRPRLEAMNADLNRIITVDETQEADGTRHRFTLPDDVEALRFTVTEHAVKLVVIDPLLNYLGKANSYNDQETRQALDPLLALAQELRFAVVAVRHPRKSREADALLSGGGTVGIIALARGGLYVGQDPDDDTRRILAPMKNNIAELPASLAFRIETNDTGSFVQWDGISTLTPDDLREPKRELRGKLASAIDFLNVALGDGERKVSDLRKDALAQGHTWTTIDRASKQLGVKKQKHGQGRDQYWTWNLPDDTDNEMPILSPPPFPTGRGKNGNSSDEEREERAAIAEYDGGQSRDVAERIADDRAA